MRFRSIVAIAWLIASAALLGWCVWSGITAWQYFGFLNGAMRSSILVGALSLVVAIGAAYALRHRPFGGAILRAGAYAVLLYALAYLLLGGVEDAPGHVPGVIALLALAPLTLYCFRNGSVRPNKLLERSGDA